MIDADNMRYFKVCPRYRAPKNTGNEAWLHLTHTHANLYHGKSELYLYYVLKGETHG